jgi:hypothetical protein
MKKLFILFVLALSSLSFGQDLIIKRIYIRHADPELIIQMLLGNDSTQLSPEISTIVRNFGGGGGGFGNSGFGGGSGR